MSRVLIAIGCDNYISNDIDNLAGAENDASNIYTRLVTDQCGHFDQELSRLLLSPTLDEIKVAFEESLFAGNVIDCLTIYYAGHGIVKDGAYFLTSSDSQLHKLSVSALPTSAIFSYINEVRCSHTNIIMDSCQSGGVVNDIGSLLKPEIIGKKNAISVSILAASASTQGAGEIAGQGICTKAILECIQGDLEIHTNRSTLDLNDLGQIIANHVSSKENQNPEYWGISLKGHVPFCLNPKSSNYNKTAEPSIITQIPPELDILTSGVTDQIWRQYFALNEGVEPRELLDILRDCVAKLDGHPIIAAGFVKSICSSFVQKIRTEHTHFEEAEILGVGLASILKLAGTNQQVDSILIETCENIAMTLNKGISTLLQNMKVDKFHLLSAGFAEYFYLPLRISKILGWIGASIHISTSLGIEQNNDEIQELITKIIDDYSLSVFSVSDAQTPCLASFASGANIIGMAEEAETVTCLMFSSFLKVEGRIASTSIRPEQVIKYLISTVDSDFTELEKGALAKPSELLSLFFVLYKTYNLTEELDVCLSNLDHTSFNIYIPEEFREFGEDRIEGGQNYTSQIGHGVWNYSDFKGRWSQVLNHIENVKDVNHQPIYLGSIVASLIDNNRVPWFLFSGET